MEMKTDKELALSMLTMSEMMGEIVDMILSGKLEEDTSADELVSGIEMAREYLEVAKKTYQVARMCIEESP